MSSTIRCVSVYWRNESRSRPHRDWHTAYAGASWTAT